MKDTMSLAEVRARLEKQIAFHREREVFHAAEKAKHDEEQARHAAALEQLTQRYEAFTAAVALVEPVLGLTEAEAKAQRDDDLGDHPAPRQAIVRVIDDWAAGATFGASHVAAEVNRRFAGKLRRPVISRAVSPFLRRRHSQGFLACVRPGGPASEGLYRKEQKAKAP